MTLHEALPWYRAQGHVTESILKSGPNMISSHVKKLLDALMGNLSEAVLRNMKRWKQVFELEDEAFELLLAAGVKNLQAVHPKVAPCWASASWSENSPLL